jgi:Flp pilus assembly protein TadG
MASVLSVPLLLAVGLAVDYSQALRARSHMQELADGGALALASSREKDRSKLLRMADDYVRSNAAAGVFETLEIETLDSSRPDRIALGLDGTVSTSFMGLANIETLDVRALAVAVRGVSGTVEVALVLDNTDSMNQDNKIGTLKTAAKNLVEELFKNKEAKVRVALVPYAEEINVGMKNRKAPWALVPDDYSKTTTTTTTKEGYWFQPTKRTDECLKWREAGSRQIEKDGVMVTETWPRSCQEWKYVNVGDRVWKEPSTTTATTTTAFKWFGCVGMRVDKGKVLLDDLSPAVRYPGIMADKQKCLTEILPLTDSQSTVAKAVDGMITSRPGYTPNTYIPGGMTWGVNVLSPDEPFDEGAAYDDKNVKPRKVIVLMTDGLNTMRVNTTGTLNTDFLKGGAIVGDTTSANAAQRVQVNADTTALCTYAKAKKIEIFTVAFKVDDGPAKTMLQSCATDAEHYYDASNSAALLAAFTDIAQSLVRVRLAE